MIGTEKCIPCLLNYLPQRLFKFCTFWRGADSRAAHFSFLVSLVRCLFGNCTYLIFGLTGALLIRGLHIFHFWSHWCIAYSGMALNLVNTILSVLIKMAFKTCSGVVRELNC